MADSHRTARQSDRKDALSGSERCARLADAELIRRYRVALEETIDDPVVAAELDAWRQYVSDRQGDVFTKLHEQSQRSPEASAPHPDKQTETDVARDLFVETLTFDFLLTRVIDALESTVQCRVRQPLAAAAAVSFDAEFETVHERVIERESVSGPENPEAAFRPLAVDFAESASPYDVARLHRECVSPLTRRAFGRYDTPRGVAELAVETLFEESDRELQSFTTEVGTDPLVLDPGCGAGAFLAAAAERCVTNESSASQQTTTASPQARLRSVLDSVRGFDVSPTAVRAARLALLLAVRPLLASVGEAESSRLAAIDETKPSQLVAVEEREPSQLAAVDEREPPRHEAPHFAPRVVLGDAALATPEDQPLNGRRADALLVNPPWLTWDALPETVKARWRAASDGDRAPNLFDHRGVDARLGFANDDLSVPYTVHCLHRLLRDDGRASIVLKRDLLTGPAGRRLRRPKIGDRSLVYDRVHDFGSLAPFSDVDAGTALFGCRITTSSEPADPEIPTTRWQRTERTESESRKTDRLDDPFASLSAMRRSLARAETHLVPTDPGHPSSPWIRSDAERGALGACTYEIRHGVKDDAKAVYALDGETIERHGLESDHIYPYLKSKHVVKYGLFGHDLQLVPQRGVGDDNEAALRRETPATYAYLERNRDRLLDRGSSWFDDGPFYSLFGLGPYTWADYKVVWCRLGFKPHFAVASTVSDPIVGEKPVVPGDHCMFVGTDDEREAHYLCALLNSAPYQRCLRDISSGGKSSLSKSTVERLALPEWTSTDSQRRLATLSQRAHEIVPEHVDCSKRAYNEKTIPELAAVQSRIDRTAERLLVDHGEPS
ncbi:type I restriction endonuclease subunit M [Halobellus captivus]|uniref:type I restriction endonuclease subunit M n=1 Tax=Halobellus captivus TaxID=2592614 RepID=UPI00119ECDE1|nr:type I restriction endonuclease subunit M [Halobellus captivus]